MYNHREYIPQIIRKVRALLCCFILYYAWVSIIFYQYTPDFVLQP